MSLEKFSECNSNNKKVAAHLRLRADFSAWLSIEQDISFTAGSDCSVLGQKIIQRHEETPLGPAFL